MADTFAQRIANSLSKFGDAYKDTSAYDQLISLISSGMRNPGKIPDVEEVRIKNSDERYMLMQEIALDDTLDDIVLTLRKAGYAENSKTISFYRGFVRTVFSNAAKRGFLINSTQPAKLVVGETITSINAYSLRNPYKMKIPVTNSASMQNVVSGRILVASSEKVPDSFRVGSELDTIFLRTVDSTAEVVYPVTANAKRMYTLRYYALANADISDGTTQLFKSYFKSVEYDVLLNAYATNQAAYVNLVRDNEEFLCLLGNYAKIPDIGTTQFANFFPMELYTNLVLLGDSNAKGLLEVFKKSKTPVDFVKNIIIAYASAKISPKSKGAFGAKKASYIRDIAETSSGIIVDEFSYDLRVNLFGGYTNLLKENLYLPNVDKRVKVYERPSGMRINTIVQGELESYFSKAMTEEKLALGNSVFMKYDFSQA